MERALVVVDDTDLHRELLREAAELAGGVDAELVLLSTMTEEEYERDFEAMETIANIERTSYGDRTVLETAANFARDIAEEEIGDVDVAYETVGVLSEEGEHADTVITVAENHDCDHIFIPGRRRSPAGKALFGDTAQGVILNFDGHVTIATA